MTEVNFYDKEQVDDLLEDKADVSSVGTESDVASETGTLWARIKYVLAHWMTKDSEQTVSAKKTFTVSPRVPTEPADDDSAISSFYVNDSTGTVENNLLHKDGSEVFAGEKLGKNITGYKWTYAGNEAPTSTVNLGVYWRDKNDAIVGRLFQRRYANKEVDLWLDHYAIRQNASDPTADESYNAISVRVQCPYNQPTNNRVFINGQRDFDASNTTDVVTIGTLIQALRYYGLIE